MQLMGLDETERDQARRDVGVVNNDDDDELVITSNLICQKQNLQLTEVWNEKVTI